MTTFDEFINQQILPALGEYAGDYDVEGIARCVSMWDDKQGYVMNPDYTNDVFWLVVGMHDKTAPHRSSDIVIGPDGDVVDYAAAVMVMDDDIREKLSDELAPCGKQEFFDAYCKAHEERFGRRFEI